MKTIHTREYLDNGDWKPLSESWVSDGILGYASVEEAQKRLLVLNKHYDAKPYLDGVEYVTSICPGFGLVGGTFRHRIYFVAGGSE